MSFWDVLLGRDKPIKSKLDQLFAISTARITLEANLGLQSGGAAGVCFKPIEASRFRSLEADLRRLLDISTREAAHSTVTTQTDQYGFQWVVVRDEDFEDLVTSIHMVSQTLQEEGFGEQLLAAVFKFLREEQPVYWIYNYKRGAFYPFAPQAGDGQQRDNAEELRLRDLMARELPTEEELARWYALWDLPL